MAAITKKFVVFGDDACGKTCLLTVLIKDEFPVEYVPSVIDNSVTDIEVDETVVQLTLCDFRQEHQYARYRLLSRPEPDVILRCFSIDDPGSLAEIPEEWLPVVTNFYPNVPIILVGNKVDLRNDPDTIEALSKKEQQPVTPEEARDVAKSINAISYLECSAKSNQGIKDLIEVIENSTTLHMKKKKRKKCTVL